MQMTTWNTLSCRHPKIPLHSDDEIETGLELWELTKAYGQAKVVDSLDLKVQPGELFVLLGPSGCGKTTILRAIAGIVEVDSGKIVLNGNDITRTASGKRDAVMVFQNYALFPHLSVFQNVAFGLKSKRVPKLEMRDRVQEALKVVNLPDSGEKYPKQMSGGQQQRVALARALVMRPGVLLLDEPLSNLDTNLREELRFEIKNIHTKVGITTVFVTHDISEAFAIGDRVAVMQAGRVEQIGTPKEVYYRPRNKYVANFMGRCSHFDGKVVDIDGERARVLTSEGLNIWTRVPSSERVKIGMAAWLTVRPEAIRVCESPSGLRNEFNAIVRGTSFLGGVSMCEVSCEGVVHTIRSSNDTLTQYAAGQSIAIGWSEDMCHAEFR